MIYTEITPNPASLKFVTSRIMMQAGTADFPDEASTQDAPIATKLFNFTFVDRVFIGSNFITITKKEDFQWEEVIPVVKDFLKAYLASDQPIVTGELAQQTIQEEDTNESDVVKKIKKLINDQVRPAVAMDGGDIIYQGFDDGIVKLKLQGSCSVCPSATMTLKAGIEGLLTRMVPQVKSVEAIN